MSTNNVLCVDFAFDNPYMNLAYEECLLDYVKNAREDIETRMAVATWQNQNAVIIGRNQSAAEECDLGETNRSNVSIARRMTGGGAVYHDIGNLNFSFILPRRYHNPEKTSKIIVDALRGLGVDAVRSGRNDILINGCKFSGNAYYSNNFAGLHHGTILFSSDLSKIKCYLTPNKIKYENNTTNSVAANVTNISVLYPAITIEKIKESLVCEFVRHVNSLNEFPIEISDQFVPDPFAIEEKYNKYKSFDWIWKTPIDPPFCEGHFEWGRIVIFFHINSGIIKSCDIVTDSLYLDIWNTIKDVLRETEYNKDAVTEKISRLTSQGDDISYHQILHDVESMIRGTTFD